MKYLPALLVCLSLCMAEDFDQNPTSDNFQQLSSPTASDLLQLKSPTMEDFRHLPVGEQQTYLLKQYDSDFAGEYLHTCSFSSGKDKVIGDRYFSDASRINTERQARLNYFKSKGYAFETFDGDVSSWNPQTQTLVTRDGAKQLGNLREYRFSIDAEGIFHLIADMHSYSIKGDIRDIKESTSIKGEIEGNSIDADSVRFKDGQIEMGMMREFAGIKIAGGNQAIYDPENNQILTKNAYVTQLPEGIMLQGESIILPGDYILHNGLVSNTGKGYKIHFASMTTPRYETVIAEWNDADIFFDEKDLDESVNFFYSKGETVVINSAKDKGIQVIIEPGNEMFDMYVNRKESGEINRVPDEKQYLSFFTKGGDMLYIQQRDDRIPLIIRQGSGETDVINGRLNMKLGEEVGLKVSPVAAMTEDIEKYLQKKHRSVPFEIESGENRLRISSGNHFVLMKDDIPKVAYNDFGVAVSDSLADNRFKSAADFDKKYPGINMEYRIGVDDSGYNIMGDESAIQPDAVKLIDQWLRDNPSAQSDIDMIMILDENQAFGGYSTTPENEIIMTLGLGMSQIDSYTRAQYPVRNNDAFNTLDHEYSHIQDQIVHSGETEHEGGYLSVINQLAMDTYKKIRQQPEQSLLVLDMQQYQTIADYISQAKELDDDEQKNLLQMQFAGITDKQKAVNFLQYADFSEDIVVDLKSIGDLAYDVAYVKDGDNYRLRQAEEQSPGAYSLMCNKIERLSEKYPELIGTVDTIIKINKASGIPDSYSLYDYAMGESPIIMDNSGHSFLELTTTYAEIDLDERKRIIQNGNEAQKELFTKIAQLRCDSGIDRDCQELNYLVDCKTEGCCERKCSVYKKGCTPCQ